MGFISYCMSLSLYIMSSFLMRYSVLMNLILQMHAGQRSMCGVIVVDAELFRSTCLSVMPIYMIIALDIIIITCFSINSQQQFVYPLYAILREATSETYAPGSIFHHIILISTCYFYHCLFCNLYFPIYTIKTPKIFILLSLSDLTLVSEREGIDNPFIALVARFLFVCVGTRRLACNLLLD